MLTLQRSGSQQPFGADDDDEVDDAYEFELVCLLGRIEQLRDGLAMARETRNLSQALVCASDLLEQVIEFADRFCAGRVAAERNGSVTRVSECFGLLKLLREQPQELGTRSSDSEFRQATIRRCFNGLQEAVFAYFVTFTNRFPNSRAARPWVEVAATFFVHFKCSLQDPRPSIPW